MADGLSTARVLIRQLQGMVGRRVRGTAAVSTVAAVTGSTTVTHGLGTTPSQVFATANDSASVVNAGVSSIGPTTFVLGVAYTDGVARTVTNAVAWEAVA